MTPPTGECPTGACGAGTRVDYGLAHSRKYRHERYGRDFSACPLLPDWGEDTRLVLLGMIDGIREV